MHVSVENFVPIKGSRVKEKDSIYRSHEKHFSPFKLFQLCL